MHRLEFPAATVERLRARRGGRAEVFPTLDTRRTALVVVDMQNFFVEDGQAGALPMARAIVPNINRLAAGLREAGGLVVWIVTSFTAKTAVEWSTFFDHFCSPELKKKILDGLRPESAGHGIYGGLDVRPDDLRVEKDRYSPFIQGASRLHEHLQARGLDTLLITGTVTNVCCESTARDAAMLNYKVVMVSDANAAASDETHAATLLSLNGGFADMQSTDALLNKFRTAKSQAAE